MLTAVLVFNVIRQNIPNTQRHFWFTALHLRILLNKFGPVYRRVGRAQNRDFPRKGGNKNVKKQQLCTCITVFLTFRCRFFTTTT